MSGLSFLFWRRGQKIEETEDKIYQRVKYNSVQFFEPIYIVCVQWQTLCTKINILVIIWTCKCRFLNFNLPMRYSRFITVANIINLWWFNIIIIIPIQSVVDVLLLQVVRSWVKIAFIIAYTSNNVVVLFGTLKVQSFMLTEVRHCDLLIVVTSSTFLKRKDMLKEKSS